MNIPWRFKSNVFRAIDILNKPSLLYFLQKYITKRSKVNNIINNYQKIWIKHKNSLQKFNATNTIFEFGAGKNLGQNLFLSQLVDKQTVVDLNSMIDFKLVEKIRDLLSKETNLKSCKNINQLSDLKHFGIQYIAPMDAAETNFESCSIDACISTNTLEHIPKDSIIGIFNELHRILKIDGIVSAQIDYSDHYAHTDPSISLLNYLHYSDSDWKKFNHNYHYQNRLRHYDYTEIFSRCGFKVVEEDLEFGCGSVPEEIKKIFEGRDEKWAATSAYLVLKKVEL